MSIRKSGSSISSLKPTKIEAGIFALPEILPERTQVLLDIRSCTAILLNQEREGSTPLLHFCQLTPSAARVFRALLKAYPQHCPYQTLFAALYPASLTTPSPVWEQYVRPIRRALRHLAPVLRAFGLEVVSLRGHGYLLAPAARVSDISTRQEKEVG